MNSPVYDVETEVGTVITYDFAADNADDGFYTVMTSTFGWNFERHSMLAVTYDGHAPEFRDVPDSNITIAVGETTKMDWVVYDALTSTYALTLNGTSYDDFSGNFLGEKMLRASFTGESVGENTFVLTLEDGMGHTATNTVIIYVTPAAPEKPKIDGYSITFLIMATLGTALLIIKKRK